MARIRIRLVTKMTLKNKEVCLRMKRMEPQTPSIVL